MRMRAWQCLVLNPKTKEWERVAYSFSSVLIYEELKDYAERELGIDTIIPKKTDLGQLKREYSLFKNDAFIAHAEINYDYKIDETED